jgi:hypothetical protein
MNRELPFPAPLADMRKPKKIESGRHLPTRLFRFRQGLPPKRNQSSLIWVKRQSVLCESLGEHIQHPLRILAKLKAQNEVIGVPNFVGLTLQPGLHLLLEPLIENIVKIDIGQQRANHLPLANPCF